MKKYSVNFTKYLFHYFSEKMELEKAICISNKLDADGTKNKIILSSTANGHELFQIILI